MAARGRAVTGLPYGRTGDASQQALGPEIADLDLKVVNPHEHKTPDRSGSCGVAAVADLDGGVVIHGSRPFLEVSERGDGKWQ